MKNQYVADVGDYGKYGLLPDTVFYDALLKPVGVPKARLLNSQILQRISRIPVIT